MLILCLGIYKSECFIFFAGGDTGCTPCSCTLDKKKVHISSPIRVSPARREARVVHHRPRHPYRKEDSRLSAKERLYVSKYAIGTSKYYPP